MPTSTTPDLQVRPMAARDRGAVYEIVRTVGNFNEPEIDCAMELVDLYLGNPAQKDYSLLVAEDGEGEVQGYACFGPTPLTRGVFDLYWIATDPRVQGQGYGRALVAAVEEGAMRAGGRLLIAETSAKESYEKTVRFYRNLDYEEVSRIRDFYDVGDDRLVFIKRFIR